MNHLSLGWERGMLVLPALPALPQALPPPRSAADGGQGGRAAGAGEQPMGQLLSACSDSSRLLSMEDSFRGMLPLALRPSLPPLL